MRGTATAERKSYAQQQATQVLIDALRGHGGKLTKSDAIAASGLPESETQQALSVLLKEYRSHLSATEDGELVYEFDPSFERRGAITWRARLAALGTSLWSGFKLLFKISIVVTLVTYFVLFVALLVALIFARQSDDDDDRGGFGFGFADLFWIWGWGPPGGTRASRRFGGDGRPRKPFYKSVFDFVFGPPKPKSDPLADDKEILAAIRERNGRIAAVDLVQLMGWDFDRAEEEVTRLLADYGGEPEVTDDGVVVYVFKDLRKTAGGWLESARPRMAWQRVENEPVLTGNPASTNTLISFFNGFNLLAPFWIVPLFEAKTHISLAGAPVLLRVFPVVFSAVFFAIPLGRRVRERLERRARARRNARRGLLARIFAAPSVPRTREALAPDPALAEALDRDLVSLGGDVAPDAQGQVLYVFPRIEREQAALERVRRAAAAGERSPGAVIFSSGD
jgi:hypothetical protein